MVIVVGNGICNPSSNCSLDCGNLLTLTSYELIEQQIRFNLGKLTSLEKKKTLN